MSTIDRSFIHLKPWIGWGQDIRILLILNTFFIQKSWISILRFVKSLKNSMMMMMEAKELEIVRLSFFIKINACVLLLFLFSLPLFLFFFISSFSFLSCSFHTLFHRKHNFFGYCGFMYWHKSKRKKPLTSHPPSTPQYV